MKGTLLLFTILFQAVVGFNASSYSNTVSPDAKYRVHWSKEGDYMRLALEVNTLGWIGFGLAEPTSGSMPGADMVIASVVGNTTTISDRYALGKSYPSADDCQDWILISGQEIDGKTIVELKRAIDTKDKQDRPFESYNKVIVAYGNTDEFSYHAWRLATAIDFWPSPTNPDLSTPNLPYMEFSSRNFSIPARKTTYVNLFFNVTQIESFVHVVALEAVFSNLTRGRVHHFLVSGSLKAGLTALNGGETDTEWSLFWSWAPGIGMTHLPSVAGLGFGPGGYLSVRLQIHYDNPDLLPGLIDNGSGVRLYYTSQLRQHEAAILELGDPLVRMRQIPIRKGEIASFEYSCPSECTSKFSHNLTVFGLLLHMHGTGKQIWGTQWRGDKMIRETGRVDFFDFNFQQQGFADYEIMPGDRIQTHCIYQGLPNEDTVFGLGSENEMCLQYIFYYPKVPMLYCGFYLQNMTGPLSLNKTICGYTPINIANPNILDPVGGEVIKFGKASTCPVSTSASTGTSSNGTVLTSNLATSNLIGSDQTSLATVIREEDDDSASSALAFGLITLFVSLL